MPRSSHTTRQRLLNTAKELFARQGITHTTTRQIAESAGVNEVTLFRHFKSKQGLLLAVFAELGVFRGITDVPTMEVEGHWHEVIRGYAYRCYCALVENPELVRSVVGEADLFSEAHRQALQRGFLQAQEQLESYLAEVVDPDLDRSQLSQAAASLHLLILGCAVMQITATFPPLFQHAAAEKSSQKWLLWCVNFWLQSLQFQRSQTP
jgi:AcrR family transcriptional regulator